MRGRSPRAPRRAFTLIEILMVVALIGVVVGFAVSRVNYWSFRMDANVRLLQNVIIGAQQLAITRNVNVQLMFDANAHRVRILQDYNNDGVMDASDSVRYRPLADGAQFLAPPTTIDGAAAAYMTGPGVINTGNPLQLAIRIAPNGSLSGDVVIYVGSPRQLPEDFRAVTIVGATSRTAFWSRGGGAWRKRDA
jgi:prepilin-type N-terminal cleavage/methylation domain-containing protein